jgi:hypothetical protein
MSEAARFRPERVTGELNMGVRGSEAFSRWTGFDNPRRLDSVEMLTGDRGAPELDEPLSIKLGIMARK